MVGLCDVDQHTPLAVIDAPPSEVMFPPLVADESVMLLTDVVDSTGMLAEHWLVVNSS